MSNHPTSHSIPRPMRRPAACLVAGLALCLLGPLPACVTEGEQARKPEVKVPWQQTGAPPDMEALAEDLMTFQAVTKNLPQTLKQLDQARLGTGGPYATRAYAYHPAGVGILREGWCVLAVNDRILPKEDGYVWTVLRAPVHIQGTPTLQVGKVSLAELKQAAQMAKGK